jgi:L-cysteine/cystine lyase
MESFALAAHRQLFPALATKQYFNYGGQGVMAQTTLDTIQAAFTYIQHHGPFGLRTNAWVTQVAQQTRIALGKLLGVSPGTIALTEDVTVGCNIALWGLDWHRGDHLLLTDCEHPGVVAAAQELQRRYGITITTMPLLAASSAGEIVPLLEQYLQSQTRLVVLSHVLWNTGQVLPLEEMARAIKARSGDREIRILVDAAQSVGLLPLNLATLPVDFYAFTGHKWCCGPEGVGGLYVAPGARADLHPTFIGWRSLNYEAALGGTLLDDSRQYEVATSAYPLYAGLKEALDTQDHWGDIHQRYQRIGELAGVLWQRLQDLPQVEPLLPTPPQSGLVAFRWLPGSPEGVVHQLEGQGIYLRNLVYPECLRACVHYLTSEEEIDRLLSVLGSSAG